MITLPHSVQRLLHASLPEMVGLREIRDRRTGKKLTEERVKALAYYETGSMEQAELAAVRFYHLTYQEETNGRSA